MPESDIHELVVADDLAGLQRILVRHPQLVNQPNQQGLPPIYTAARHQHQAALELLLQHAAAIDIFACGYLGRADGADRLLQQNPSLVHDTTNDGRTALHYAAMAGHLQVVQVLLQHDAETDTTDQRGRTALLEACHGGPWKADPAADVIQLLLESGAATDLWTAAAVGLVQPLQEILDRSEVDIDALNPEGQTAVDVAARNNRLDAVRLLVERGADVNRSDAVGTAALHRTSGQCSDELIRYLIQHGADADLCCYVACGDAAGTARVLRQHPESLQQVCYEYNAVGYAIHCWQLGPLRVLLESGAVLSDEDRQHILRISGNNQQLLQELLDLSGH